MNFGVAAALWHLIYMLVMVYSRPEFKSGLHNSRYNYVISGF